MLTNGARFINWPSFAADSNERSYYQKMYQKHSALLNQQFRWLQSFEILRVKTVLQDKKKSSCSETFWQKDLKIFWTNERMETPNNLTMFTKNSQKLKITKRTLNVLVQVVREQED